MKKKLDQLHESNGQILLDHQRFVGEAFVGQAFVDQAFVGEAFVGEAFIGVHMYKLYHSSSGKWNEW
ncbi:hypothetical protein FF1_024838 [Malus domestica]